MLSAIYMAVDVFKNRKLYDELHANVLKVKEFDTPQKDVTLPMIDEEVEKL